MLVGQFMLLTQTDLSKFQIDPRAIELVPEAVARDRLVLPVGFRDATLQLVLPAEAGFGVDDTIDVLRFVLAQPFIHQFAVTANLRPFVDFYYTAVYSEITKCESRFRFQCPKQWAELNSTDDIRVRFCNVCERSVTYCSTPEELAQMAARGDCVAFLDRTQQQEFLGLPE